MRRAVILGRVSRDEGQDPQTQIDALEAAAERHGWQVAEVVKLVQSAWDSASAAEVRRKVLAPIEAGRADTLMIWAWDRFSREGIEGAFRELRHLESHLGAQLFSLQEPFLCTTADPQQRELLLSIIAWAAKWESERKSQRLRACVRHRRANAGKLGQRARWGKGVSATHEEVAQVHELRATGATVRAIGAAVNLSKSQVATILRVRPVQDGQNGAADGGGHPPMLGQD